MSKLQNLCASCGGKSCLPLSLGPTLLLQNLQKILLAKTRGGALAVYRFTTSSYWSARAQSGRRAEGNFMRIVASWGMCVALALVAHTFGFLLAPAQAQTVPKYLEGGGSEAAQSYRRNNWTVGITGGQLSGTYMTFANELAEVLDDSDNLRVIPIVTYGAASNMDDLLYLRGVDIAVTQADVFDYFRTQRKIPYLESRVNYIVRLPLSEVHILAGADIKTIDDLKGKKVSFGPAGSASSLTGTIVFQRLGVQVEQALVDNPTALQKLKSGEIAALVRVIGKPIDFFAKIPANSGLHFLPIPFSKTFADYYTLAELSSKEYPTLVSEGQPVETIGVPAVLAVYNWQKGSDRYRRVERFTEAFFSKWDKFREPPRHPKWRDVNLAATVPGWTRWSFADEMLRRLQTTDVTNPQVASTQFLAFLKSKGYAFANLTQEQRDALFVEFLQWQKQRSSAGR
jgi:TRAP transporter TAXI family solute receptor